MPPRGSAGTSGVEAEAKQFAATFEGPNGDIPLEVLAAIRIMDRKKKAYRKPWEEVASPAQLPPPAEVPVPPGMVDSEGNPVTKLEWSVWLIQAGRGWGKTRTGAEFCAKEARKYPGIRIALVAATFGDGRDTMVEGESGLLSVFSTEELRGGSVDSAWNRSLGELFLANGSRFKLFSSEKPRQLRGPQHHIAWGDEPAFWNDSDEGTAQDTTWSNLRIGVRLPPRPEWSKEFRPRIVLTTTPRPVKLLKNRDLKSPGLLQDPRVVVTRGKTTDNLANLSKEYRETVVEPLMGTRLGRQELEGDLLEDVPGALWDTGTIDRNRLRAIPVGISLTRVVVAIDPAVTSGEDADDTGIIVAGKGSDGHGYVLGDYTCHLSPDKWAREAVRVYYLYEADKIIAETNNGGDMVKLVIRTVDPNVPYKKITATRGKRVRAEPVAAKYEQGKVHHVGNFPELEDELCSFTPDTVDSPNRLDGLVWAISELMIGGSVQRFAPASAMAGVSR